MCLCWKYDPQLCLLACRFQADLRLPAIVRSPAREAQVQHVVQQLGLQKVTYQAGCECCSCCVMLCCTLLRQAVLQFTVLCRAVLCRAVAELVCNAALSGVMSWAVPVARQATLCSACHLCVSLVRVLCHAMLLPLGTFMCCEGCMVFCSIMLCCAVLHYHHAVPCCALLWSLYTALKCTYLASCVLPTKAPVLHTSTLCCRNLTASSLQSRACVLLCI